jgi:hypothetical protein
MPAQFTIINCAMAMDGGSLSLSLIDGEGVRHTILIPQFADPMNFSESRPPGSLIFDGKVVCARGEEEKEIIQALKTAKILAEEKIPDRFHNNPHVETSSDIREFMSGSEKRWWNKPLIKLLISSNLINISNWRYRRKDIANLQEILFSARRWIVHG